jgi:hypothetical protein
MGLDIVMVGMQDMEDEAWEDKPFQAMLNYFLHKLPGAREVSIGETPEALADGHRIGSYSALHVLRGLALRHEQGKPLDQLSEKDLYEESQHFYENAGSSQQFQHLLNHSDCDGYYVPYDFAEPLLLNYTPPAEDEDSDSPEQISVGSSLSLLQELNALAPLLALPGDLGELGEDAFASQVDTHRWPTAAQVWGILRCYARESAENRLVMVFC